MSPAEAEARLRADAAKTRFTTTASELQARLSPSLLAQHAWEGAVDHGTDLWDGAVDRGSVLADDALALARRKPGIAAATAAAVVALIAGGPVLRRIRRKHKFAKVPARARAPMLSAPQSDQETPA